MRKEVTVPLALLVLPSLTFALLLLSGYSVGYARHGGLPSSPQPAWLHFCLTHQRLFARLELAGMACSLLNAALATFYFRRGGTSTVLGPQGVGIMTPLFAAVVVSLVLALAVFWIDRHTSWLNATSLSQAGSLLRLIEDNFFLILSMGVILVLMGSVMLIIFLSALFCIIELFSRFGPPAPPRVPGVLAAKGLK